MGENVKEQMLIGETLFSFDTPRPIHWRPEEQQFDCRPDAACRQRVQINIQFLPDLPELMARELYRSEGLKIGLDGEHNEVRIYSAAFLSGRPVYAASVLRGSTVTVYFVGGQSLWDNPNIRVWNLVHMERLLLNVGALVLHCSYLMYQGKAILFSAPSGTGKTTQAKLWEKLYPAEVINGDKAILQKRNGVWHACGYVFHGSADECRNESHPIEAIVVVRQSPEDRIEPMGPMQRLQALYSETTVNVWNRVAVDRTLDLIGDLAASVEVVRQHCTMRDEACRTLHRYLTEE